MILGGKTEARRRLEFISFLNALPQPQATPAAVAGPGEATSFDSFLR
jgi:hypothetical protein